MRQQMAYGDLILEATGKIGEVPRDRRVQIDAPLIKQHHDGRGGADHLGQRREIVNTLVDRHGTPAAPIERAESARHHRVAFAAHHHRRAGVPTGIEAVLDHALNVRQALGGHAHSRRLPPRQSSRCRVAKSDEQRSEQQHDSVGGAKRR